MIAICPKCDEALVLMEIYGIEIDFCNSCRGIWLDDGELESIVSMSTPPEEKNRDLKLFDSFRETKPDKSHRNYRCPRCDRYMKEIVYDPNGGSELKIELCPRKDGIWFDADELQQLLEIKPNSIVAANAVRLLRQILNTNYKDNGEAVL